MQQNQSQSFLYTKKLVIFGDSSVGKTSLILRLVDNTFNKNRLPTISPAFRQKIINICRLQVWDQDCGQKFNSWKGYIRGVNGIIIVYDACSRNSFRSLSCHLKYVQEQIKEIIPQQQIQYIQYMLVGTKIDLVADRQVCKEEGQQFAKTNNMIFFEVSSLSSENVLNAFEKLTNEMLSKQNQIEPAPQKINTLTSSQNKKYLCI